MKLLEIHLLQSFVPSLLNRSDTGSPKDCLFGGQRRARISSQSWKKAMRDYVSELELLTAEQRAVRSKRLHQELKSKLERKGEIESDYVAEAVLVLIGAFHIETDESNPEVKETPFSKRELKSEYLVYLGNDRIDAVAKELLEHWDQAKAAGDELKKYRTNLRSERGKDYKGSLADGKKADEAKKVKKDIGSMIEKAFGKELTASLDKAFDGSKAIDLALFGRMLADLPEKNVDGATQVAHAISTHTASREFDFYTAVDDLKPEDTSGADMIGTVEFSSACYYRYAAIDLEKFKENLSGVKDKNGNFSDPADRELVEAGLIAFLRAFVEAIPSGKQKSHAAQNPPSFGAFRIQEKAHPRNLANAFEKPIGKSADGFIDPSIKALDGEWQWSDATYGDSGTVVYWSRSGALDYLKSKEQVKGAHAAIVKAVEEATRLLGL